MNQRGCVIWLTGLSASGKTTIAQALEQFLYKNGKLAYVLDGDNMRHGLNSNLGFSAEDRDENIRRIGEVAALFADASLIVIAAFISPYRQGRDRTRQAAQEGRFMEVFLDTSLDVCEKRDPKGLYRKARAGEISDFTGIDAPYEKPLHPELTLNTDQKSVQECVLEIVTYLKDQEIVLLSDSSLHVEIERKSNVI